MDDFVKDVVKGLEYLKKLRRGETPQLDRMEKSIETQPPQVPPVPAPPQRQKPMPPEPKEKEPGDIFELLDKRSSLQKRSVRGSAPFTDAEIKRGYRKL